MTIFDDVVDPIKDAFKSIVKGVEAPIHVVESLFGTVIHMTEEFIQEVLSMIEDMRTFFNASNVEKMFFSPFKAAAMSVIGDVDKLYNLVIQASPPSAEGIKDDLMVTLNAAYTKMKSGMTSMVGQLGKLVTKLQQEGARVAHSIMEDFNRVKALLETFPTEIGILKRKILEEIKVIGEDAFSVLPDIPDMIEKEGANVFHAVQRKGEVIGADFTNFEASVKNRFTNENAAIDLFYLVIIGGIIAMLVSVFMVTKSTFLIMTIVLTILIALVIYAVVEFVLGVI